MGKKTVATGMVAVIVVTSMAWVLRSGGAERGQAAVPTTASAQPGALVGTRGALADPPAGPAPTAVGPSAAKAFVARPTTPAIVPPIAWARYPGTLHTQVQQALQGHDGVMAADLARKLRECEVIAGQLQPEIVQRYATAGGDAAVQAIRNERLQEYQRILANCQTVADGRRAQHELLEVAMAQKVIGAAVQSYHLGQRRPEVLQAVVRDALAGDVNSLAPVTYHAPSAFNITPELQRSLRYAFEVAAGDPDVGRLVRRLLDIAESASVALAKETLPRFNHDGLTEAQRAQAREIASQLVRRVKEPRDEVAKAS